MGAGGGRMVMKKGVGQGTGQNNGAGPGVEGQGRTGDEGVAAEGLQWRKMGRKGRGVGGDGADRRAGGGRQRAAKGGVAQGEDPAGGGGHGRKRKGAGAQEREPAPTASVRPPLLGDAEEPTGRGAQASQTLPPQPSNASHSAANLLEAPTRRRAKPYAVCRLPPTTAP